MTKKASKKKSKEKEPNLRNLVMVLGCNFIFSEEEVREALRKVFLENDENSEKNE